MGKNKKKSNNNNKKADKSDKVTNEVIETQALNQNTVESSQLPSDSETTTNLKEAAEVEEVAAPVESTNNEQILIKEQNDDLSKDNFLDEIANLKLQLDAKTKEAHTHSVNYHNLLGKLTTMKKMFDKMKESEAELNQTKLQLEELKDLNKKLKSAHDSLLPLQTEITSLSEEASSLSKENSQLKFQLVSKEKELSALQIKIDSSTTESQLQEAQSQIEEYLILLQEEKVTTSTLQTEIKSIKSSLTTSEQKIDSLQSTVKNLEGNLTNSQEEIKSLKLEAIRNSDQYKDQLAAKKQELESFENQISVLQKKITDQQQQLEEVDGLKQEINEKQLTIGKLRHENITNSEHLTKALRLLKRSSNAETVDRELVSNLFINFLQFDRGDPKKFEVLTLIANFLNWDDEKKKMAGLIHSSKPFVEKRSQSFVALWTEFLEKEST